MLGSLLAMSSGKHKNEAPEGYRCLLKCELTLNSCVNKKIYVNLSPNFMNISNKNHHTDFDKVHML